MPCCGGNPTIFYPSKLPTGGDFGPTIQNGRLTRRRDAYFSKRLFRVSQLIEHPGEITYREFCILVWALYALYRFCFFAQAAWHMLAAVDVQVICDAGQSLMGCSRDMLKEIAYMSYLDLAKVVPWAFLCVAVVFVGEEVMRQRNMTDREK